MLLPEFRHVGVIPGIVGRWNQQEQENDQVTQANLYKVTDDAGTICKNKKVHILLLTLPRR